MSELNERRWAAVSERGVEATDLTYDGARDVTRTLVDVTKSTGATIVTNEAAAREVSRSRKGN